MWHEARKQERKIRGMMVDYRRRAERRRDFYEKIKADPTQFLQLHGRQCKIHLDPAIASAADSPATMMPWQGQRDNLIDRFDVRAHLDFIPFIKKEDEEEVTYEERQINYERYRIIAQNSFLCISEEKFLKQLHMEEQFGYTEPETKKKKGGATIGFNYEEGSALPAPSGNNEQSDENSDSDLDVDLYINVSKVDQYQAHEMNKHGLGYGMSSNDFYSFLTDDMEEAENNRLAREEEHEKALFAGRKSRRERRAHREKRLANRVISPPSYAARLSPTYPQFRESKSASRSPTPDNSGKITYITSFGDEEETPSTSKMSYAQKVKYGKKPIKTVEEPTNRRSISNKAKSGKWEKSYNKKRSRSSSSSSSASRRYKNRKRSRSPDRKYRRSSYSRSRERSKKYRSSRRSTSSSSSTTTSSSSISNSSSSSGDRKSRSRSKNRNSNRAHGKVSNSSRSSSSSSSRSDNKNIRNKSPIFKSESPPKVTGQRYYGRKRSDQSSSSDMDAMSDNEKNTKITNKSSKEKNITNHNHGNAVSTFKKSAPVVASMSLQERLKKKRQALLNKQYKADKLAEQLKSEREKQEQQNREDELREMAIKLRRRQREIRHAYDSHSSKSSSDSEDGKANPPVMGHYKSRSNSPLDSSKSNNFQESSSRGRESIKSSKEKSLQSSPKLYHEEEMKSVNKEDNSRKKSVKKDDSKREYEEFKSASRENYKSRSSNSRSLVDY